MKRRLVPVALVAAGALVALAAQPARSSLSWSAASIVLSRSVGPPTTQVTVIGASFGSLEQVNLTFDAIRLARATTDGSGGFTKKVKVPRQALPGDHTVTARGRSSGETASAVFTVRTDWPMLHFSGDRRGENPYENLLSSSTVSGLELEWTVEATDSIYEGVAVAGGVVYVADANDAVLAIDASSGAILWKKRLGVSQGINTPSIANGVVYLAAVEGEVFALDASSGSALWSVVLAGLTGSSPLVANGMVYVGAGSIDGTLYALDADTGDEVWTQRYGGGGGSPAFSGGVVYMSDGLGSSVSAFDADTGAPIWSSPLNGWVQTTPAVSAGLVYVGTSITDPERAYAVDAATGAVTWTLDVGDGIFSSPTVAHDVVYEGSNDDTVYALDAVTGDFLWSLHTGGNIASTAIANGVLYVSSQDDLLYAVEASTGTVLWSFTVGDWWADPVVADGRLYAGSYDGSLYAFGLP